MKGKFLKFKLSRLFYFYVIINYIQRKEKEEAEEKKNKIWNWDI